MGFLADLLIRIGGDATDLRKELSGAKRDLQSWGRDLESVGRTLTAAVTVPLAAVGAAALKTAGELEQNSIAFTTMMKSADAAQKHLTDLKDFALKTPFQFNDLVLASKRMQALGFEAQTVLPALRNIGDAAAALGMGAEGVQRIVTALGQMKAKGTVQAEEMRQLAEAGIPAWQILAKVLNTDVQGAMKLVEARAVDAGKAVPAILAGINERFGGLMEQQSKTFMGQLSNLKDALTFTFQDIGKTLLPIAKNVLENVLQPMLDGVKNLAAGFAAMPAGMQQTIVTLGALAAAIGPTGWALGAMATGFSNVISLALKLPALLNPVALGIAAIATAAGIAFYELNKSTAGMSSLNKEFSDYVTNMVKMEKDTGWVREKLAKALEAGAIGAAEYAQALSILEGREKAAVGEGMQSFLTGIGASITILKQGTDAAGKWTKAQADAAERAVQAWIDMDKRYAESAEYIVRESKRLLDADEELQRSYLYGAAVFKATHAEIERDAQRTVDIVVPLYDRLSAALTAGRGVLLDVPTFTGVPDSLKGIIGPNVEADKKALSDWKAAVKLAQKEMNELERESRRAFDGMARSMARSIVDWKGWAEGIKDVGKNLATSFLEIMIRQLFKPLENQFAKLAGWIGGLLGGGSGAASSAVGSAASAGASVAGSAASAGGGAASAVGGIASAGIMGTIGAIGSVGSMVSGIIGNFQFAGMNKTLDLIEHETRYTHGILQSMMDLQNLHLPKLESIWGYLWEVQTEYLNKITWGIEQMSGTGGGKPQTINVYLDSKLIWSGLASQAQLAGVR